MKMSEAMARQYERQMTDPEFLRQRQQTLPYVWAALSGISGAACLSMALQATRTETSGMLWWERETTSVVPTSTRIGLLIVGILLILVAAAVTTVSIKRAKRGAALKQYLAILAGVEVIKIQKIADITGQSGTRVIRDILAMIGSGLIEDFYIDYEHEQVVSRKYVPKTSHKTVVACSGCGGNNEVIVGITRTCSFCGQPLRLTAG